MKHSQITSFIHRSRRVKKDSKMKIYMNLKEIKCSKTTVGRSRTAIFPVPPRLSASIEPWVLWRHAISQSAYQRTILSRIIQRCPNCKEKPAFAFICEWKTRINSSPRDLRYCCRVFILLLTCFCTSTSKIALVCTKSFFIAGYSLTHFI